MSRRVLLLGAGAAHVGLLRLLANPPHEALAGTEIALLAPQPRAIVGAALAGWVDGSHGLDASSIDLPALAQAARVHFVEGSVVALDAAARRATLADGRVAEYELLSLEPEPVSDRGATAGAREHALALQPLSSFVRLAESLWELAARRVLDVVVIGAGADAVELALALEHRLCGRGEERARVALVTGGGEPLPDCAVRVQRLALRRLAARRITVFREACAAVEPGTLVLQSGALLACDAPVLAGATRAPAWLAGSGLRLDAAGQQLLAEPTLQSASHPEVFLPHGAVGAALLANLRRFVAGTALLPVVPRRHRGPQFIASGAGRAIVAWGGLVDEGRWCGWWQARSRRAAL
jgi:NADH dehydrogenase FAD-containing subunit